MDHMMPGMDGIEATRRIREIGTDYAKNIPIIALTANAIVGNEEMFLEKGFQAFISKPIEIIHLDAVIREWVRDKEQEELYQRTDVHKRHVNNDDKNWKALENGVPGLNIEKGLSRFSNDKSSYIDVLRSYSRNTPVLLAASRKINKDGMAEYITVVHGIRGSSSGINAEETAAIADALEKAAIAGDYDYVSANNKNLIKKAEKLITDIDLMLEKFDADNKKPVKEKPDRDTLVRLHLACLNYDMNGVDTALEELESNDYEFDGELVVWLRENAELMNLDEICKKLSTEGYMED